MQANFLFQGQGSKLHLELMNLKNDAAFLFNNDHYLTQHRLTKKGFKKRDDQKFLKHNVQNEFNINESLRVLKDLQGVMQTTKQRVAEIKDGVLDTGVSLPSTPRISSPRKMKTPKGSDQNFSLPSHRAPTDQEQDF